MDFVFYFLIFTAGTFFGSFYNLVADRIVKDEQVLRGRSKCDFCKKALSPKNLIPLFSYIIQRGKCAFCHKKLNIYYPVSEVLTGLVFVYSVWKTGILVNHSYFNLLNFFFTTLVFSVYIIVFLTDVKYRIIPDKLVLPTIILIFLFTIGINVYSLKRHYNYLVNDNFGQMLISSGYWELQLNGVIRSLINYTLSSIGIAGFFIFLVLITKGRGMGGGDIRLGLLIGLFNGFPSNILGVFLGFVVGAIYSLVLIAQKKKTLKDTIAFGPFLILGSLIAYQWGTVILDWYFNLF